MNYRYKCPTIIAAGGLAALLVLPSLGFTQSLGSAATFAVLAGSTVTNTGASTTIVGSVGVSPGTEIIGLPPGQPTGGTIHAGDGVAAQAQSDLTIAYNSLAGMACGTNLTGQDLGGMTLAPGVYCFNTSAQLTGTLTLDAQGDGNAIFVIQIGSTLTTATIAVVDLIGGAQPGNVYWQVGSSATLGTGTEFAGNIVALESISLTTGASLAGRALARTGAVTMDTNAIVGGTLVPVRETGPGLSLQQNYPNPFNPSTTIAFETPSSGRVRLDIFDVRGRLVRSLVDESMPSRSHSITWDGRDDAGNTAGSGIYFYRLEANGKSEAKKMVVLK